MIITSTPYRISFFGGGTDYPAWYEEHGGQILACTINRYCYLSCRNFPPFFDFKHRIVWSEIENVPEDGEIKHPAVREAIKYMQFTQGLEIHHNGDLPARSGLGSSSSFAVGLLHAFHALKGEMISKADLAREAIHLERDLLKENVGIQDQILTAYGGINLINIFQNGDFQVDPLILNRERERELQSHLMLFYTGIVRTASEIAGNHIAAISDKTRTLNEMVSLVPVAAKALASKSDINDFGRLLHETWMLKRSITPEISNSTIDNLYQQARNAGAIGGKLMGAGGGGFVLLFVPPDKRQNVLDRLTGYLTVPFEFEQGGSRVIVCQPEQYSVRAMTDRGFVR